MRYVRSLNGNWQFQLDPEGLLTAQNLQPDKEISVPLPWQVTFPDLAKYSGYAWYKRSFEIELTDFDRAGEFLLSFGAVDYWCEIFVNNVSVGQHEGGYTPFTFSIKSHLRSGTNQIAVKVYDSVVSNITIPRWPEYPTHSTQAGPTFDATQIPHGKQEWYINVGGIWQDVTLTSVPARYLENVHVSTNIYNGEAHFLLEVKGGITSVKSEKILVSVQDSLGKKVAEAECQLERGQSRYKVTAKVDKPVLWDTTNPYLYTATANLDAGDDELTVRFGFREITTQEGQLLLNGQPLFLLAALDQDIYADTIYTVPSTEYLIDQFRKAKELGLNCLRCHIKPPDPRYLDLADEMGLLVWAEIPSWRTWYSRGTIHENQLNLDDLIKQRVEFTLKDMVLRDFNHPSLIIWTLVNEDWGTSLAFSGSDRAWVSHLYDYCKQLDPTRLVVDNSACLGLDGPNVHVHSDLDDFHIYTDIPEQSMRFEQIIEQFNLRPTWTYSSHGDIKRTGKEPLILSEFGNWGLPSLKLIHEHYGKDPEWFQLGPWWARWEGEPGWPKNVGQRFESFGLNKIWKDYEDFAVSTQWHQFNAMKFEIETMRRQPNLAGYVITELADIYWESNGLLDFLRNPKIYHTVFADVNALDVVVPQPSFYSLWDDKELLVKLFISHYSTVDLTGSKLISKAGLAGTFKEQVLSQIKSGRVEDLGTQKWIPSKVDSAQIHRIEYVINKTIANGEEKDLARNYLEIVVLPGEARQNLYQGQVAVIAHSPSLISQSVVDAGSPAIDTGSEIEPLSKGAEQVVPVDPQEVDNKSTHHLENVMHRVGYQTTSKVTPQTKVAITNYPNAQLLEWVKEGGDLLFLSTGPSPFFWVKGRGSNSGWITAYNWLKPGIHKRLVGLPNPIGLPFTHVAPTASIVGLPFNDPAVQDDLLSGSIQGWVNHPSVNTLQFRYGKGRVIMTTYTLEKAIPNDPIAVAMLHDLIEYLHSDACQPNLRAD